MKNKIIKRNKGFTMVELLLVLGLVSLMTLGIYSQLGKSEKETESLNEVQKLITIFDSVEKAFISNGQYQNVSISSLKNMGIDVETGGKVSLTSLVSTSPTRIEANYASISREACGLIASKMVNTGKAHSVRINGINLPNGAAIEDIVRECTGDTNQLVVIRENNTTGVILRTQQDGITNLNSMVPNNINACPNGVCGPGFTLPAVTTPPAWNNTIGSVPKPTVDTSEPISITPPVFTQAPSMSN